MKAAVRERYKNPLPRPPEHRIHLPASPLPSPAPIEARRAPQLRRRSCPSRHGRGQILRQRGTVRRLTLPVASLDHGDDDAVLARVNGGRSRRNHHRQDAGAAVDEALRCPDLPSIDKYADELLHASLNLPASSPNPLPRPSRRKSSPVSSPEHRRTPFCFSPRWRRKRFGLESVTSGSHWSGF